jgi:predicted TIM-barrel fold metal-dependent hydrolase
MTIIDSHMHIGLAGFDADSIVREMDLQGIDQSWLLTWKELHPPVPQRHMDLPIETILEACERYPQRLIPFFAPDPATEDLKDHFNQFLRKGILGCGELKVSRTWDDPLIGSYLEMVQELHMALVFHMELPSLFYIQEKEGYAQWIFERLMNDKYNGVSRYYISMFAERTGIWKKKISINQVRFPGILFDFEALEQRIVEFPGIRFVGHGPDFWNGIGAVRHPKYIHQKGKIAEFGIIDSMLEQYDNFYCDISGTSGYNALNRDREQSRIFLQKHKRKVLYGTDNTRFPLQQLLKSLKLGKEVLENIMHRNATRVLQSK